MLPEVKDYRLQDFEIFSTEKKNDFIIWIPDKTYIVLGRANHVEESVHLEYVVNNHIEILKRPSGGEAVLLSPRMIVIALKFQVEHRIKIHNYFKIINLKIISALETFGINNLQLKGISDIAIYEKKILGSAMYKKNDTAFYHAVLNVSESPDKINLYLKHPKREPDYRIGRTHVEFVTSLLNEGYQPDFNQLIKNIEFYLSHFQV